ncbi:unnamed protein product [Dicrocoelium dendriticum]|nr:unnamed protein product [Dicrocoelium dendriticum]
MEIRALYPTVYSPPPVRNRWCCAAPVNPLICFSSLVSAFLESALDHYVSGLPVPTHVERMGIRSGLVKSRLRGASISTGKTLTFLDAHCEATTGWLEPLLLQIAEDHRRVACPIIDVISETTFEYITGSDSIWGTFDWGMSFHWTPIANRERARTHKDPNIPVKTPVMAGGLFTISRDYFYEIGSYDEGMIVWGGENVEMSVRLWQCGGELLIVPCSRVGHVFRKVSPYVWPGGVQHVLSVNSLRTVLVWLDEFKDFYLKSNPGSFLFSPAYDVIMPHCSFLSITAPAFEILLNVTSCI